MSSTDSAPRLIPGVAAVTWQRAYMLATYFSIPGYLLLLASALLRGSASKQFGWIMTLGFCWIGLYFVCVLVMTAFFTRRRKLEAAAGYSTRWATDPTIPQLDSRTGEVIRAAGEPYVKRSDWLKRDVISDGNAGFRRAELDLKSGRPTWGNGARALFPVFLFEVVLIGGIGGVAFARGVDGGISVGPRLFASIAIGLLCAALLFTAIVGVAALVVHARLERMAAAAPGELTFVFGKSREYGRGFIALTGTPYPESGYIARGASANASGLTLWHGNPPTRVAHLEWQAVTSIQPDSVPGNNNSTGRLALITFKDEFGDLATLPLAWPKVNGFPIPSKTAVRWIINQLNELRGAKTTTRLI